MDELQLYTESKEDMQTLVNTPAKFSTESKMQFGVIMIRENEYEW